MENAWLLFICAPVGLICLYIKYKVAPEQTCLGQRREEVSPV